MSIDFSKKYSLSDGFERRILMEKITFTDFDKAQWIRVNEMGDMILSQLDGRITLEEIMSDLSKKYRLPVAAIENLCRSYLEKILDLGLIYSTEDIANTCEYNFSGTIAKSTNNESYPHSVWIHITGRCNLNCSFCYSNSGAGNTLALNRNDIFCFLDAIPVEAREEIVISGGEPLLYPDFDAFVKELKEQMEFKAIRIISNGTVGHDVYGRIAPYISGIQFSVDGPVSEINDLSRGEGAFEKMIQGISDAKKAGIKNISISFTQTVDNFHYLKEMPQFMKDNGIYRMHITRIMPVGRGRQSAAELGITHEEFMQELDMFYEEYLRVSKEIAMDREVYDVGLPKEEKRPDLYISFAGELITRVNLRGRKTNCGLGKNIISVNYDGNVYACPSLHMEPYLLGDIHDDIHSIMAKGAQINRELSVDNPNSDCSKCKYKYFCGGNCAARKLSMNGIGIEDLECITIKETIDKHIATLNMED